MLRRGREDIERVNQFLTSHCKLLANAEDSSQKCKESPVKKDGSESEEILGRQSKKFTPEEINLQKVLQSPECLDETAITINFLTRRLLCDMFDLPIFRDFVKTKIEMKLKELAVSSLRFLHI